MENTNYPIQEKIHDLVQNKLDPAQQQALREQARQQPELSDELRFSQNLALALRNREMLAASAVLTQVITEEGFPTSGSPSAGSTGWKTWLMALVVALSVGTGVYFWATSSAEPVASETQQLAQNTLQPLENVLFIGTASAGELKTAMQAYDAADYPKAAQLLAAYTQNNPDFAALTYLGVARLMNGQAQAAIAPLADAQQSQEPPVQEAARWYLGLAYLATNRPDAAREVLLAIPPDSVFGPQAAQLLQKIQNAQQ